MPLAMHAAHIRKTLFGNHHPAYAHALGVLAKCYHAVRRYHNAQNCLQECLHICGVAFPKNHANLIPNLMTYGEVLRSTGDLPGARKLYQRAIAIHDLNFGEGQQAKRLRTCLAEVAHLTSQI